MKKIIILFLFLMCLLQTFSQDKVIIEFKEGKKITYVIDSIKLPLTSLKNFIDYNSDSIVKVSLLDNKKLNHFYFLKVKTGVNFNKKHKGVGSKIYTSGNIDVFYIYFSNNSSKSIFELNHYEPNPKRDIFIKRKNENFAYSIGCMDGIGCLGFKQRLKKFFHDCPTLIKEIRKKRIGYMQTIKIVDLYNSLCVK